MKVIRKVWIGNTIKGNDTMSWEVGQSVSLGSKGRAMVDHIKEDDGTVEIFVKKENLLFSWKKSKAVAAIEYDVDY